MAQIHSLATEKEIELDENKKFVTKQDVPSGSDDVAGYTIKGPEGFVVGVDEGTPISPEFRDANGVKLDGSTIVRVQKCDKLGNPLSDGIVFESALSKFDYDQMRTDSRFFRYIQKKFMVDEREIVKIFVITPDGSPAFSAAKSRLTIGDATSSQGKPVEIVNHDDLSAAQSSAVKQASQVATGGN